MDINTLRFFYHFFTFFIHKKNQVRLFSAVGFLFLLTVLLGHYGSVQASNLNSYRFAADDKVSIIVFGEPDLSLATVRIATNGSVSIPLIGQVDIQGLTADEVEKKLTLLFSEGYLKKPAITVSIVEYRQFYINGEVKKPGGYSFRDGLTVEKAVTLAGGFSERAAKGKITIVHEKNIAKAIPVKLTDSVKPGDIITVGESFF